MKALDTREEYAQLGQTVFMIIAKSLLYASLLPIYPKILFYYPGKNLPDAITILGLVNDGPDL